MSKGAWRATILTLCAVAGVGAIVEFVAATGIGAATAGMGIWGNTVAASSQPYYLRVGSIDPGRASSRAGLRPGDLIAIRRNSTIERFGLFGQPLAGRPVTLWVRRGSLESPVVVTPLPLAQSSPFWDTFLTWPGIVWSVFFAGLIAWRRADVREMRLLSLTLVALAFWFLTDAFSYAAANLWTYVALACLNVFGPLAIALWAACAGALAPPLSPLRRTAARICYTLVAVSIALNAARLTGILTLWIDPIAFLSPAMKLAPSVAILSALACGMLAIAASPPDERRRSAWLMVPPALLFLAVYAGQNVQALTGSYALWLALNFAATAVVFATPVALTYAALSRRLVDVGFVLNRALVFGIVSTIVVGGFVLVEWIAGTWFATAGHASGALAGAAVALVLGLSLRYIHKHVDGFVDRVFFRKRYEDEAALRQFAHEAAYVTEPCALLESVVRKVREHTAAADVSILTLDGAGAYVLAAGRVMQAPVSENDPAIVAMRAWHKPVDLHRLGGTALRGELAFPMISRGELLGTIVCEAKRDGEGYAPDETDALRAMAVGVGAAFAALRGRNPDEQSVRDLLARILERLPPRADG